MAAPMDVKTTSHNSNLIDELESSFLDCLSLMTSQDHFNVQEIDETKTSIENAMQKFLELSRKTEAFFLRKRMLVSFQKPEQVLNEDNAELRAELQRKDQLIEKHLEKLKRCQMLLKDRDGAGQPAPQQQQPSQQQQQQQQSQPMAPIGSHPSQQAQVQSHIGPGGAHLPQYSQQHHVSQIPSQNPGVIGPGPGSQGPPGPYQGYPTTMHAQGATGLPGPPQSMQSHSIGMGQRQQPPPSYPQGPLAFLEQTTSNIGLPDNRR